MILEPVPHPEFEAAMQRGGATRLGPYTWTFGTDEHPTLRPLREAVKALRASQVVPKEVLTTRAGNPTNVRSGYRTYMHRGYWLNANLAPGAHQAMSGLTQEFSRKMMNSLPRTYKDAHGFIGVNTNGKSIYLTAYTMESDEPIGYAVDGQRIDATLAVPVNLRHPGRSTKDPKPVYPAAVLETMRLLSDQGAEVLATDEAAEVLVSLDEHVVAYPAPGRPAEVAVAVGLSSVNTVQFERLAEKLGHLRSEHALGAGYGVFPISKVEGALAGLRDRAKVYMHPKTEDLYHLAQANPVEDPKLRDYQQLAVGMHLATQYGYVNALEPGMGKGHPVSTNVLTPTGWRRVGDLSVGDLVIGSDGRPTPVTGVFPRGELDVFNVSFSDGTSVTVDGDHLWTVRRKGAPLEETPWKTQPWAMTPAQRLQLCEDIEAGSSATAAAKRAGVSTPTALKWHKRFKAEGVEGLADNTSVSWHTQATKDLQGNTRNTTGDRLWRIPMTSPVHLEHPGPRPVAAYVLGAILGDGNTTLQPISVFSEDTDMADLLRQELPAPVQVKVQVPKNRCPRLRLVTEPSLASNPVRDGLRDLGLLGLRAEEKFVPDAYLYAPLEDRIALFQGMMDTDGYYDPKGRVLQFYSSSEQLADAVAFLVESFGGNARRTVKQEPTYQYAGELKIGLPAYKVTISLPEDIVPFRLERKASVYQPRTKYPPQRIIDQIEAAGREDVVCISVAAQDQLYLTEHCIVTHNTICALDAMRRRAETTDSYRGLVVAEANVRAQWGRETEVWAPDVRTLTVYGSSDLDKLEEALADPSPLIVITSYAIAGKVASLHAADETEEDTATSEPGEADSDDEKTEAKASDDPFEEYGLQTSLLTEDDEVNPEILGETPSETAEEEPSVEALLSDTFWHDLVADEAAVLRNPGTSQAKALWRLRNNSGVAMALTGTPITRNGVDDLGRLIAWTRNDMAMFTGAKLSDAFDVADDIDLASFHEAVGPLVLRRNKADISAELPGLKTDVVMLEPTTAELELARAARDELKRVYLELVALMELAEEGNPDDERVVEAKDALAAARGAWLGGTQLARMAAADPAALVGSKSAGAELLAGTGLIEAANRSKGTKRRWAVDMCKTRVSDGKQVIFFTEFATVARGLIEDLEAAGIRAGGILGGGGKARDRNIDSFRDGDLDVLVATSAGKRGLNLQTATTVVHYDLPWTPDDVAQRTARVERIGATAAEVEVLFPISKGTIEERIVALLATRAATAVRALDVSRGADGSTTDMGRILAGLLPAVDEIHLDEGQMSMLDITRKLVT